METLRIVVNHPVGLHARPAAKFVQAAGEFASDITVSNTTEASEAVNAKSILSVLTLGVHQGVEVEITAEGPDEREAIEALSDLIQKDFED